MMRCTDRALRSLGRVQAALADAIAGRLVRLNGMDVREVGDMVSCTGGRWRLNGGGGTTYGRHFVTSDGDHLVEGSDLHIHEREHAFQWRRPGFPVAYLAACALSWLRTGTYWAGNRYEREAGLERGGYPPEPRARR